MDIKIFIAAHKPCMLPEQDCYVPIHVGAKGKDSIPLKECGINKEGTLVRDDDGINISEKNPYYCELTATYYIWKNIKADVVGLCHYRRYFSSKKNSGDDENLFKNILSEDEIAALMAENDIVVPKTNTTSRILH